MRINYQYIETGSIGRCDNNRLYLYARPASPIQKNLKIYLRLQVASVRIYCVGKTAASRGRHLLNLPQFAVLWLTQSDVWFSRLSYWISNQNAQVPMPFQSIYPRTQIHWIDWLQPSNTWVDLLDPNPNPRVEFMQSRRIVRTILTCPEFRTSRKVEALGIIPSV